MSDQLTTNKKSLIKSWLKTFCILVGLYILTQLVPTQPIDPWGLFNLKKIITMIWALTLIQALGQILVRALGVNMGYVVSGFLGGLISSTATTAALARQSKSMTHAQIESGLLIYLSAMLAMTVEALALSVIGLQEFHNEFLFIFLTPIAFNIALILFFASKNKNHKTHIEQSSDLKFSSILILASIITAVLALSKMLQVLLGKMGLGAMTFLVSLFEIHGSIIANTQLHESGVIDVSFLCDLLTISLIASYSSKIFMIFIIGSADLRKRTFVWTAVLLISSVLSLMVFKLR